MATNNIKIHTPTHIKDSFYNESVKDLKKAFKCTPLKYMDVTITDEYDDTGHIVAVVRLGNLITTGCVDNQPWTEAYDVPKLIKKLGEIGFNPSYFNLSMVEKKDKRFKVDNQYLNMGFTKKVPKKESV